MDDSLVSIENTYHNDRGGTLEISTQNGFVLLKWMGNEDYVYLNFTPDQATRLAESLVRAAGHINGA